MTTIWMTRCPTRVAPGAVPVRGVPSAWGTSVAARRLGKRPPRSGRHQRRRRRGHPSRPRPGDRSRSRPSLLQVRARKQHRGQQGVASRRGRSTRRTDVCGKPEVARKASELSGRSSKSHRPSRGGEETEVAAGRDEALEPRRQRRRKRPRPGWGPLSPRCRRPQPQLKLHLQVGGHP